MKDYETTQINECKYIGCKVFLRLQNKCRFCKMDGGWDLQCVFTEIFRPPVLVELRLGSLDWSLVSDVIDSFISCKGHQPFKFCGR